ncbi:hypothetical protein ACHAWU_003700 [Discostella pseudostelligera]|uniref:Exonuclease 1 n=1 Tax=Discostella pseudostelligera TaxID=259834 RepID=A0ABD3NFA2_9STRA
MGVKNGAKTLHSVTGLTLADVAAMGKGLANEKQIMPRIVADCSNLLFVFSKCTSVVSAVAGHLSRIAASGVIMVPVCDGAIRPISKQATNKRIADKELSRIKAFHCRTKMIELKNRLVQESLSQVERDAITAEIRQQDTKMKRNETQSQRAMPQNFANDLEYELSHSNAHSVDEESAGGFVDHVVVAEFQADSYMAAQSINQNAVMVMTKDSDIPIIAGDDCISIKSFTKGKYEIVSTSESTLKHAMSYLPEASKQRVQFNAAANPVFDGVSNVRLRALIMLVLGCDVYIPGMKAVKGMSALRFVHSEKRACEDELFASLHQKFMEANKLSKQEVDTYIDAIIYEPTNHARVLVESPTEPSCCIERTYLFERPTSLPRYLEQYSIDDKFKTDSIFDGPATLTCKGVGERKHLFLAHEGHDACHNCKVALMGTYIQISRSVIIGNSIEYCLYRNGC